MGVGSLSLLSFLIFHKFFFHCKQSKKSLVLENQRTKHHVDDDLIIIRSRCDNYYLKKIMVILKTRKKLENQMKKIDDLCCCSLIERIKTNHSSEMNQNQTKSFNFTRKNHFFSSKFQITF